MTQIGGEAHIQQNGEETPALLEGESLLFPQGLVGFQDLKSFSLRPLSGELSALIRIDSEDQPGVGFYLLPLPVPAAFYTEQDISQMLSALELAAEETLFLLIVSSQRGEDELVLTVNVRAPLVVNVTQRQAWQYVFVNQQYEIAHEIARVNLSPVSEGAAR